MTNNVKTRNTLNGIPRRSEMIGLLDAANISEKDRELMRLRYIDGKDWGFIADTLGYSLSAVKRRHAKILDKISRIL